VHFCRTDGDRGRLMWEWIEINKLVECQTEIVTLVAAGGELGKMGNGLGETADGKFIDAGFGGV
jgi:hypothetical protein